MQGSHPGAPLAGVALKGECLISWAVHRARGALHIGAIRALRAPAPRRVSGASWSKISYI